MASSVFVLPSLASPRHGDFIVLQDDAAEALRESEGAVLTRAISPWGTDAVFNRFQLAQLLNELKNAIAAADDPVRANLQAVHDFIEFRALGGAYADFYVVFLAD